MRMWKKILKVGGLGLIAVLAGIQFYRPEFRNSPIVPGEELGADGSVPADVSAIITRSCSDCHTNQTRYPWYAQVSPISWFLADHINKGRGELNFSVWNTYSARKKVHKLGELCEQIEVGEMPLNSYLWIHRDAVLSESDKKLLCDWTLAERQRIESSPQNVSQ